MFEFEYPPPSPSVDFKGGCKKKKSWRRRAAVIILTAATLDSNGGKISQWKTMVKTSSSLTSPEFNFNLRLFLYFDTGWLFLELSTHSHTVLRRPVHLIRETVTWIWDDLKTASHDQLDNIKWSFELQKKN